MLLGNTVSGASLREYYLEKLKESKNKQPETKPAVAAPVTAEQPEVVNRQVSEAIQKKIQSTPIRRDIIKALMSR